MALENGTKLGHYEITDPIGKGGMGEVYRARDTRLGRDVAIKVLPAELAEDAERVARLEREARMLAALNHPNIAAIHGLEQSDATRFLVLELVEGDTLADRLKRGPISVEEALEIALQIADALEAAHEKGVIHRDLKPANIKVTPEDRVKVLDFGLAKAFLDGGPDPNISNSPTLSMQATRQGVMLGTAAYMSPEQARGEAVDQRADVWAFGCVLFELLSGEQTWSGRTVTDVIGGIVAREPDWSRLPGSLHPRIRFLLERCLEKEVTDRCQGIAEARAEIRRALADPGAVPVSSGRPPASSTLSSPIVWTGAVALALLAAAAGWFLRPQPAVESGIVTRFSQELGEGQSFRNVGRDIVAISPDGRRFVYNTTAGLYLRTMDDMQARLVPGTESALSSPVFSPDGEWIAYWQSAPGQLRKIPVAGGSPVTLTTATNPQGASWGPGDRIVFGQAEGIMAVSGDGGEAELLVPAGEGEELWDPQMLPDGRLLFTAWTSTSDPGRVSVASPGGEDREVLFQGERAVWVPTGHLVVTDPQGSPNTLLARPFDLATLRVGGPVPMEEGVFLANGKTQFAVSPNGSLVYPVGSGGGAGLEKTLVWVDRDGRKTPVPIPARDYTFARISPDGTKVALVVGSSLPVSDPAPDIWIFDLVTENLRQLTFSPETDDGPVWSPDGGTIYFRSMRSGSLAVYSIPAEGGEAALVETDSDLPFPLPWSISADGETLAIVNAASLDDVNVAVLPTHGGEVTLLLNEPVRMESEPTLSANGAWIADTEAPGPQLVGEINVRPFPDVGRALYPVGPGMHPVFSGDGSELFYFDGTGIVGVPLEYEPFRILSDARESLFGGAYWYGVGGTGGALGRAWDVDPNGERFLMINVPGSPDEGDVGSLPTIDVIVSWLEELKERVPTP